MACFMNYVLNGQLVFLHRTVCGFIVEAQILSSDNMHNQGAVFMISVILF